MSKGIKPKSVSVPNRLRTTRHWRETLAAKKSLLLYFPPCNFISSSSFSSSRWFLPPISLRISLFYLSRRILHQLCNWKSVLKKECKFVSYLLFLYQSPFRSKVEVEKHKESIVQCVNSMERIYNWRSFNITEHELSESIDQVLVGCQNTPDGQVMFLN